MKVSIVYASTTGNTEAMANAIAEAVKAGGAETSLATADSADKAGVTASDLILLGSPAMGDEVLEDSMEEFFAAVEGSLSGKKIGLFGSYDWGDGQWLRDWEDRVKSLGGQMAADIQKCKDWASAAIKQAGQPTLTTPLQS